MRVADTRSKSLHLPLFLLLSLCTRHTLQHGEAIEFHFNIAMMSESNRQMRSSITHTHTILDLASAAGSNRRVLALATYLYCLHSFDIFCHVGQFSIYLDDPSCRSNSNRNTIQPLRTTFPVLSLDLENS